MSLSLCMIVKNEEMSIGRCLSSVRNIVDEMIIVDTGSTDKTMEIAKSFGSKVLDFEWNDNFSDARNYSLKHATGDWILLMDADDELDEENKLKIINLLSEDKPVDAYFLVTLSYLGEEACSEVSKNLNVRLIRNKRGYYFSGMIHEQIYSNILRVNPDARIENKDISINHYGYLNKNIELHEKRKRNMKILEKELEAHPDSSFNLFNMGTEYLALGDHKNALNFYERAYERFNPNEGYSTKLIFKMVHCLLIMGRSEEAIGIIEEALKFYPEFTDLEHLQAIAYCQTGQFMNAVRHLRNCIKMGEAPFYYNMLVGAGTYRSHYLLGQIYLDHGDYLSAKENLLKALKCNREFVPIISTLIAVYCKLELTDEALKRKINKLKAEGIKQYENFVYDVLLSEKRYKLALYYVNKAIEIDGKTPRNQYYKGLCKLHLKKYAVAYSILKGLTKDEEFCSRAFSLMVLSLILQDKPLKAMSVFENSYFKKYNPMSIVCNSFYNVIYSKEINVLSDDEEESSVYTNIIFEYLSILLSVREFELFEKALGLLSVINDKTVLLRLAKLYYSEKCYKLAFDEFMRSIKIFDTIDAEGLTLLLKLKYLGY